MIFEIQQKESLAFHKAEGRQMHLRECRDIGHGVRNDGEKGRKATEEKVYNKTSYPQSSWNEFCRDAGNDEEDTP